MSASVETTSRSMHLRRRWWADMRGLLALVWSRFQTSLMALLLVSVIGVVISAMLRSIDIDGFFGTNGLGWCIAVTQLPLLFFCMFGFDLSTSELDGCATSMDRFLIRSPVSSSALAAVPIACKTIGTSVSLAIIYSCLTTSAADQFRPHFVATLVALLAIAFSISAISWRPFRHAWHRGAALLLVAMAGYGLFVLTLMSAKPGGWQWAKWVNQPWPAWIILATALALAFRWMALARIHSSGLPMNVADTGVAVPTDQGIPVASSLGSELRWYDRRRLGTTWQFLLGLSAIVFAMVMGLQWLPFNGGAIWLLIFLSSILAHIGSMGGWANAAPGRMSVGQRRTPDLLAVSPISIEKLAIEKLRRCIELSIMISLFMIVLFAISTMLTPSQDNWSSRMQRLIPDGQSAGWTEFRVWLAVAIACVSVVLSTTLYDLWLQLWANDRVTTIVAMLFVFAIAVPMITFLVWIIQQTDWEHVLRTRDWWVQQIPKIVVGLLIVKAIVFAVAYRIASGRPGHQASWCMNVTAAWMATTVTMAALMMWILPSSLNIDIVGLGWLAKPDLWMITGLVALAAPLSRILILPWSMAGDIHR